MIDSTNISARLVSSHYDELDLFYREVWGEHLHHGYWQKGNENIHEATVALVDLMIKKLHLKNKMRVCDVGCGYGATSRYIVQQLDCELQAFTISENQFNYARTKSFDTSNPKYSLQDWMTNSLDSDSMDVVFSIESSEHMPEFSKFFSQCHRVLKPGGQMAVFAWLESETAKPWMRQHLLQPLCDEGRMRLASKDEYVQEFAKSGLNLISFDDLSAAVSRTWTLCIKRTLFKILTRRKYQKFIFSKKSENRDFAKSIFRIRAAYATGAMKYGLFIAEKK